MEQPDHPLEESAAPAGRENAENTTEHIGAEVFSAGETVEKPARRGFFHWLFNPETGFGRFMRKLVRGLALVIGLLALGVLAAYILLYRPLQQQYRTDLAELESARQNLSSLTQEVGSLRTRSSTLEASFSGEQNHVTLLRVMRDVTLARAELAGGDPKAASTALERAKKDLTSLDAAMKTADSDLATTIRGRLDLALTEIAPDADTAISDLVILAQKLEEMEKLLFPNSN
jgi:hypothetical protein